MNKAELRKHAGDLAGNTVDLLRAVLVKHNMGVIEGAAEKVSEARNEALDDVLKMLEELHAKVQKPTPLEKGMRMAIGSAMDRVIAMKTPNVQVQRDSGGIIAGGSAGT
jgi:hypothetical protein